MLDISSYLVLYISSICWVSREGPLYPPTQLSHHWGTGWAGGAASSISVLITASSDSSHRHLGPAPPPTPCPSTFQTTPSLSYVDDLPLPLLEFLSPFYDGSTKRS